MRRDAAAQAAALGSGLFAVYCFFAYPCAAPRDAADLARAAFVLGVAHPPGYPLYSLLGRAWLALFPFGDVAHALNLLSCAAAAAACGFFFLWCRRRLGALASAGLSLAVAFSAPMAKFALLGEKYALHAAFLCALLLAAEGSRASLLKRAALGGLLFGLSWVNHQTIVLAAPGLLLLWLEECRGHEISPLPVAGIFAAWACAGAALSLFVLARLGSWRHAWWVLSREPYGSFSLYSGFARPLNGESARSLLGHFFTRWTVASSPLLAALAVLALRPARARLGLLLLLLLPGPGFLLLSRFDASQWVARSALEPAFIFPVIAAAALAACFLGGLSGRAWAPAIGLAAGLLAVVSNAPFMSRRDDFSAYDYLRDLRRGVPRGARALTAGDTVAFGMALRQATTGVADERWLDSLQEEAASILARGDRPLYSAGLSFNSLAALGLDSPQKRLAPAGLVQRVDGPAAPRAWDLTALRIPRSFETSDSYAHDVRLSYAFAHYLDGQLERDPARQEWDNLWAAALDPEDYVLGPKQ